MAQTSGFFNALQVEGVYDRKYNADDYCNNLAVVISNGVLRTANDDLKVTAAGMVATVATGRAWINGHYYMSDTPYVFAAVTAPIGGSRYDRVMLRLNTNLAARSISLIYVEGEASNNPVKPAPTRSENIYDLVLADIYVEANATSVSVTDTRSDKNICGWVYSTSGDNSFFTSLEGTFYDWFESAKDTLSSVTLFKRYTQKITLAEQGSAVAFNIPQYDADTCFMEVYVNGILETRYTVNNTVITFAGLLIVGTVIQINVYKSIDGTGIMSVSDEITELQNQVASLTSASKFSYTCTGLNDNISLSQIAQAFYTGSYTVGTLTAAAEAFLSGLGGNAYLASLPYSAQLEIDVIGSMYANVPFAGNGTEANRYKFFVLGSPAATDKKIVFNFAKSERIYVECGNNTFNTVLGGVNQYIKNANIFATSNGAGCSIQMMIGVSGSKFYFDNCELTVVASNQAIISNTGNFTNCKCTTKGATISRCFDVPTFGFVRINGGTFYAYGTSSVSATVFYITTGVVSGLIMAYNINTPIVAQTGYVQKALAIIYGGKAVIDGVVNYSLTKTGGGLTVTNEIVMNKAD